MPNFREIPSQNTQNLKKSQHWKPGILRIRQPCGCVIRLQCCYISYSFSYITPFLKNASQESIFRFLTEKIIPVANFLTDRKNIENCWFYSHQKFWYLFPLFFDFLVSWNRGSSKVLVRNPYLSLAENQRKVETNFKISDGCKIKSFQYFFDRSKNLWLE